MSPVPRLAESGDVAGINALVQRAYGPYIARLGVVPGPLRDDYARHVKGAHVYLIDGNCGPDALLVLIDRPDHLLLDNVAVAPEAQGRGLGRLMIAFAEEEARRRGFGCIRLYTHVGMAGNHALYRHLGFSETHRVTEKGLDRVYFAKNL